MCPIGCYIVYIKHFNINDYIMSTPFVPLLVAIIPFSPNFNKWKILTFFCWIFGAYCFKIEISLVCFFIIISFSIHNGNSHSLKIVMRERITYEKKSQLRFFLLPDIKLWEGWIYSGLIFFELLTFIFWKVTCCCWSYLFYFILFPAPLLRF